MRQLSGGARLDKEKAAGGFNGCQVLHVVGTDPQKLAGSGVRLVVEGSAVRVLPAGGVAAVEGRFLAGEQQLLHVMSVRVMVGEATVARENNRRAFAAQAAGLGADFHRDVPMALAQIDTLGLGPLLADLRWQDVLTARLAADNAPVDLGVAAALARPENSH